MLPQSSHTLPSACSVCLERLSCPSFHLQQESQWGLKSSLWGDSSTSSELIKDRKATGCSLAPWFPLRWFFEMRAKISHRCLSVSLKSPGGQEEDNHPLVKPQTVPLYQCPVFMTSHRYGCYTWNMSNCWRPERPLATTQHMNDTNRVYQESLANDSTILQSACLPPCFFFFFVVLKLTWESETKCIQAALSS